MKTLTFDRKEDWEEARRGKIAGTRVKDLISVRGGKKTAYYELIAERMGVAADDENPMERGLRLEEEALTRFEAETGKKVDRSLRLCTREDDEHIAYSPDGSVIDEPAGVEVKCLSSAKHVETYLTQKCPNEYELQVIQSFVVNEDQQTLYMVFYDPRVTAKPFFFLTIKREDKEEEIAETLAYERDTLREVREIVTNITF